MPIKYTWIIFTTHYNLYHVNCNEKSPFAALYITDAKFVATTPAIADMKMILAASEAFRRGYASWLKWKADSRFVLIRNAKSSAVKSRVCFCTFVPTLFT